MGKQLKKKKKRRKMWVYDEKIGKHIQVSSQNPKYEWNNGRYVKKK